MLVRKNHFAIPSPSKRRRTRSVVRAELFASTLPILVQNDWLGPNDLSALEQTYKDSRGILQDDDLWKALCSKILPDLTTIEGLPIQDYRSIFHEPRAWIEAQATRVRALPKWSRYAHYDIDCSRCGSNSDGFCGNHIRTEYRYDYKKLIAANHDLAIPVPNPADGERYMWIGRICEQCFEPLIEKANGVVQKEDYDRIRGGTTLFDYVYQEMMLRETKLCIFECDFPFSNWPRLHEEVELDDIAVVVAYALIHPECNCPILNIGEMMWAYQAAFLGERGYKALAFAVALNTTLTILDFDCPFFEDEHYCHSQGFQSDSDLSNGLFAKALRFNTDSALEHLILPEQTFGKKTRVAIAKAKPGLKLSLE